MQHKMKTGDKILISDISTQPKKRGLAEGVDNDEKVEYISQVDAISEDGVIHAFVPIHKGHLVRLPVNVRYRMVFYTQAGMMQYSAKITEYFKDLDVYFMKVVLIGKGESVQSRQFFRFECTLPILYTALDGKSEQDELGLGEELPEGQMRSVTSALHNGLVRDISGGGMCFQSNDLIKVDQRIRCRMQLGRDTLHIVGTVLKSIERERKNDKKKSEYTYEYYVRYSGITAGDQERIIRYIFAQQRELLKAIR